MSETIAERIARIKATRANTLEQFKAIPTVNIPTDSNLGDNLSPSLAAALNVIAGNSPHFVANITLNEEQQKAVTLAASGQTFCLAGAAGTGKTTTTKEIIKTLEHAEHVQPFTFSTKYLTAGQPGIVVTSFTKRATKNAAEAIQNSSIHCVNFHKLVQYEPVFFEVHDPITNTYKKSMRFEPAYNSTNPLPRISTIVIDESSQFSIPMFNTLWEALGEFASSTQFIFIGDIQQIPPTMGTSIYGPKLNEHPSIELTRVYRQALESPIIRFLTDMRSGHTITRNDWQKYTRNEDGTPNNKMRMGVFPPKLHWEDALHQASSFLKAEFEKGIYNPYEDMVLVPFNVKFGTVALNKLIAEMLDSHESRLVHQVIVGWQRAHYAIGDHILYNTEDYVIESIEPNPKYMGVEASPPSKFIDREGIIFDRKAYEAEQLIHAIDIDLSSTSEGRTTTDAASQNDLHSVHDPLSLDQFLMAQMGKGLEEKTNTGSHSLIIRSLDDPETPPITLENVGDLMKVQLSYAITVHKAQGLQAPRVYFFLHSSHSPMHFRELIYTAASRAKDYLTIICDPKILAKGIDTQRIPGITLEEKKQHFIKLLGPKENPMITSDDELQTEE